MVRLLWFRLLGNVGFGKLYFAGDVFCSLVHPACRENIICFIAQNSHLLHIYLIAKPVQCMRDQIIHGHCLCVSFFKGWIAATIGSLSNLSDRLILKLVTPILPLMEIFKLCNMFEKTWVRSVYQKRVLGASEHWWLRHPCSVVLSGFSSTFHLGVFSCMDGQAIRFELQPVHFSKSSTVLKPWCTESISNVYILCIVGQVSTFDLW